MNNVQLVAYIRKQGLPMQIFYEIADYWYEWIFQKELIEHLLDRFFK